MQLKDQVCTLEQAKVLKEIGVKQDGYFVWHFDSLAARYYGNDQFPSAYTVAEISEMLPTIGIKRCKSNNGRGSVYHWLEYKSQDWSDENEAKLLAKFLIYLLENKLVDVATINNK